MGLLNRCSWSATDAWLYPYCFNGCEGERNWVWTHGSVNRHALDWDGSPFLRSSSVQHCWWLCKMLPHTGTTRSKRTCGICELICKAYMPCVSGFPYRVYIDSNRRGSQIWVTACLIAAINLLINDIMFINELWLRFTIITCIATLVLLSLGLSVLKSN
jgi:hypothetical protein